ncbi:MAG TPA: SRPBCC family protein, partial [Candidatus Limnocylindrales bacterium]
VAYALFSAPCIDAMAVDPVALGMTEYRDTYDDLGEVVGWVHDLGAAWAADLERRRVVVSDRDAGYIVEVIQPAPRDLVWSFVTDPALRPKWQAGVTAVAELPTSPRRSSGSMNHCMHGADVLVEEILDWRPIDHVTTRTTLPNGFKVVSSFVFEDAPEGTRVRSLFTWGRNRREREELASMRDFIAGLIEQGQSNLHDVLAEEMARRTTLAAAAPPEPAAPESLGRELREPIRL